MANYIEVKRGQSSAQVQPEEIDMHEPTKIVIEPTDHPRTCLVTEYFKQHKPETRTFDSFPELAAYLRSCLVDDDDQDEEEDEGQ